MPYVLGEYGDGVTRDITDPELGTEYVSLDPDIVAVSAASGLTATGEGITTILVRNGAVQESITATVLTDGQGSCGGDGPSLCLNQARFRAFQGAGSADADKTGKVVQGLQAGTTYTFRVRAKNQHGNSGYSNQASATTSATPQPCTPGAANLCLNGSRFKVEVSWRDFQGNTGQAQVAPLGSDDSGLFWFFDAANWEMLVKVLDGCGVNDHFWVFAAATTNVRYTLRVSDSVTGSVTEYRNPLGTAADAITDTGAFAVCP